MAPILTPDDVVRRIAAECTFVNERGGVGIRLKPRRNRAAIRAAIPRTAASAAAGGGEIAASALNGQWCFRVSFCT